MKIYSHDVLAGLAAVWLGGKATRRNVRGNFEISVYPGCIPDYTAIGWLERKFCQRYNVPGRKIHTLPDGYRVFEIPDMLFIFEAKATRSDFLSTFNDSDHHANRHKPIGSLHWVVANRGVAQPSEVPSFWGLLEPRGRGLCEMKKPVFCEVDRERVYWVSYELLWKQEPGRYAKVLYSLAKEMGIADELELLR